MSIDRNTHEAWLLDRLEGRLSAEQERVLDAFLAANPDLPVPAEDGNLPHITADAVRLPGADAMKRALPPVGMVTHATLVDHLIARAEGDLDAPQLEALERYLIDHPEAGPTARLLAACRVSPGEAHMPGLALLQRHFPPLGTPDRARITDFLIAAHEGDLDAPRMELMRTLVAEDLELQREERLVGMARMHPEIIVFPWKEDLKKRRGRVAPLWPTGGGTLRWAAAASVLVLLGLALLLSRERRGADDLAGGGSTMSAPAAAGPEQQARPRPDSARSAVPVGTAPRQQAAAGEQAAPRRAPAPLPVAPAREPMPQVAEQHGQDTVAFPPLAETAATPQLTVAPAGAPEQEPPIAAGVPGTPDDEPAGRSGRTVGELIAAGVRTELLGVPDDTRPLDGNDALALAHKGLKRLTGGRGGVEVERSSGRNRFRLSLGQGLAFSGSIGR